MMESYAAFRTGFTLAQAAGLATIYGISLLYFHHPEPVLYSLAVGIFFFVTSPKERDRAADDTDFSAFPQVYRALFFTFLTLVSAYVLLAAFGHRADWIVVACGVQLASLLRALPIGLFHR